jgi:hypothetical protein
MDMQFRIWTLAMFASVILGVLSAPAPAHHSIASFWNEQANISIAGVVKQVRIMNPHSEILVDVTEGGQTSTWLVLGSSVQLMRRAGINNDTVKPGATITIDGHPARKEGAKGILARTLTMADGKKFEVVRGGQRFE